MGAGRGGSLAQIDRRACADGPEHRGVALVARDQQGDAGDDAGDDGDQPRNTGERHTSIVAGAPDACGPGASVSGPALSPEAALAWLSSLSIDLEATAVVDVGAAPGAASVGEAGAVGAVRAGDPALGRRAAQALAAAPGATDVDHGDLLAVRSGRHAVAATVGRHALRRLVRGDLAAAAAALGET